MGVKRRVAVWGLWVHAPRLYGAYFGKNDKKKKKQTLSECFGCFFVPERGHRVTRTVLTGTLELVEVQNALLLGCRPREGARRGSLPAWIRTVVTDPARTGRTSTGL